ncbi:MAG: GNAT family N-acetyltransferase [Polyangiales bacterium]
MLTRRYDADWRRDTRLSDGTEARFRWLRPDDATRLREGFSQLSPESVRMRFPGARGALRDGELRYLTECDQENHLAICAASLVAGPDGALTEGEGLGVARSVRLPDEPHVAESAVVVADRAQRKGVGRRLLVHLARAAMERGVDTFRCEVLEENAGVRALLSSLAPTVTIRDAVPVESFDEAALVDGRAQAGEARVLVIDVPLSPEGLRGGAAFSASALAALLRLMAARALEPVHRLLSRLTPHPP